MTRLGILGGGQLAQMLTQAAISLGIETAIFERTPDCPAARLTWHSIVGQWDDEAALSAFAGICGAVTLENEFVDADVLRRLEAMGLPVYPTSATLAAIQDKLLQKQAMATAGLPVSPFRAVESPDDVLAAAGLAFEFGAGFGLAVGAAGDELAQEVEEIAAAGVDGADDGGGKLRIQGCRLVAVGAISGDGGSHERFLAEGRHIASV